MAVSRIGYYDKALASTQPFQANGTHQIIADIRHQPRILSPLRQHLGRIARDQRKPEPGVIHTQVVGDVEVLSVVEENDVEFVGATAFRCFGADEEVAVVRVCVEVCEGSA
jgi:hypothetical protein